MLEEYVCTDEFTAEVRDYIMGRNCVLLRTVHEGEKFDLVWMDAFSSTVHLLGHGYNLTLPERMFKECFERSE